MQLIYLDYNRTTPLAPSVLEAMQPFWSTHYLLPGQEHPHAKAVSEALDHARENVAALVGCEPFELVFTGGGTEANNLAIRGFLKNHGPGHVLVSELEHESVLAAANSLRGEGWTVQSIPCESDGTINPERIEEAITADTRLACVQLANPVLGTLQPIREIADILHNRGVALHCDASQGFGKLPVDASQLRADTVSLSGHKLYGPKGSGVLYVRKGLHLQPVSFGEPREMGLCAGAENVPACIGLGAAAAIAGRCAAEAADSLAELRDHFWAGISQALSIEPIELCAASPRLPNTCAIELEIPARQIQKRARKLVFSTAQTANPPDMVTRSLQAIGRTPAQISRTLSISLGWTSSRDQLDQAIAQIAEAAEQGSAD